ncbi:MAG: T9SS type A sorting domain-containing protein [Bacteroidia bacterium]|nr:T9SS type A sorting domain-containing protein [Bacteroidia bacterium]
MKKLFTTLSLAFLSLVGMSQTSTDTLLWENFQGDTFDHIIIDAVASNALYDTFWYDIDGDGLADASGSSRSDQWFLTYAFSVADSITPDGDTNVVFASNSWTNDATTPVQNMLILPSIHVNDASVKLLWKSAPFQTPRYCDGYAVVASIGTNEHTDQFTDTLFKAAEFISQGDLIPDSSYSEFEFSDGYVHGLDGSYIEYDNDSLRFHGVLKPFEISLDAYVGMDVYIAFLHNSHDDNLISIDDIAVVGNGYIGPAGIKDFDETKGMGLFPNPANDHMVVNFTLRNTASTSYEIIDMSGKMIANVPAGIRVKGNHSLNINTQNLANGNYIFNLVTNGSRLTKNFTVAH